MDDVATNVTEQLARGGPDYIVLGLAVLLAGGAIYAMFKVAMVALQVIERNTAVMTTLADRFTVDGDKS